MPISFGAAAALVTGALVFLSKAKGDPGPATDLTGCMERDELARYMCEGLHPGCEYDRTEHFGGGGVVAWCKSLDTTPPTKFGIKDYCSTLGHGHWRTCKCELINGEEIWTCRAPDDTEYTGNRTFLANANLAWEEQYGGNGGGDPGEPPKGDPTLWTKGGHIWKIKTNLPWVSKGKKEEQTRFALLGDPDTLHHGENDTIMDLYHIDIRCGKYHQGQPSSAVSDACNFIIAWCEEKERKGEGNFAITGLKYLAAAILFLGSWWHESDVYFITATETIGNNKGKAMRRFKEVFPFMAAPTAWHYFEHEGILNCNKAKGHCTSGFLQDWHSPDYKKLKC